MSDSKFKAGDKIEVLDISRQVWMPAKVLMVWRQTTLPHGLIGTIYDVEGIDEIGPFNGRWNHQYVRSKN